jgi:Ca2+-binding RTX toxin-like protein
MATITGTLGDDPQIIDLINQADTIYGDFVGDLGPSVVSGSDRIFGRDFGDEISGDARNLFGATTRGGNDVVFGGKGDDAIFGDAELFLSMGARGGDDTLNQGAGFGVIFGDALNLDTGARGGNDRLSGAQLSGDGGGLFDSFGGNDVLDATRADMASQLSGDSSQGMAGTSRGGRDTLKGSSFDDVLSGDALGDMEGSSRGGNDSVSGFGGDDQLYGDVKSSLLDTARGGNDGLRGGAGNDTLYGDAEVLQDSSRGGNDNLFSGGGNDQLWGDGVLLDSAVGGADRFHFDSNFGEDTINDFDAAADDIVFRGYTQTEATISIAGADSVFTTFDGDTVTVLGFTGPYSIGDNLFFV